MPLLCGKVFVKQEQLLFKAPDGKWGAGIQLACGRIDGCYNPIAFGSSLPSLRTVLSQKYQT
ncbi:hypothetical protein GBA52_008186 [Prunus armeniaca]|nr:hypothetical protein GBA52_008186 [Prunus armeniaca]